jgi:CRP-like cAMP-binding protein
MSNTELFLPSAGIIANLEDDAREILAAHGSFQVIPAGGVLIKQGKPHGKLFCVISGRFEARREYDGSHDVLGRIEPGDWIGEVDIFDPSSAMCSVVAAVPSKYWEIGRERLEEFLNTNKTAAIILLIGLASTLGQRIRGITQKLAEQTEKERRGPQNCEDPVIENETLRSAADLAAAFLRQKDYSKFK